jgi:small subunit ribosomal protein S6
MNIECDNETLSELEGAFKFNDAVLRHLTIRRQVAVVEQSEMLKAKEEKDRSSRDHGDRRRSFTDDVSDDSEEETDDESELEMDADVIVDDEVADEKEIKTEAGE